MLKLIKRCALAALAVVCTSSHGQFVPGQVLTAAQLNTQFALYLPLTGGVLTGPLTVPGLTLTGPATMSSISGLTSPLTVPQGGTGLASLTQYSLLAGNGSSIPTFIAPGTAGTLIASNGVAAMPSFQTIGSLGIAPTASPTFTGTLNAAAITASGLITPNTVAGIAGTTLGDNAQAGSRGEVLTNATTGTSITTGTTVNATSVSLTAGDWMCYGQAQFVPAASTIIAGLAAGITTTSVTLPGTPDTSYLGVSLTTGTNGLSTVNTFIKRMNVTTTTTVYVVARALSVTVSTATVNGNISCVRFR